MRRSPVLVHTRKRGAAKVRSADAMSDQRILNTEDALFAEHSPDSEEHTANVLSLRRAAKIGVVAWPLFGIADWLIVTFIQPGRLWLFLLLRVIGLAVILVSTLRLHARTMPSPGALRVLDTFTFIALSVLISAACVEFGGIASPLSLGIVTLLACRIAIAPDRWQRGLVPIGLTAAAHPLTLVSLAFFSPAVEAQLRDSQALALFALNQLFVFGTAAITVVGGHKVWGLRRRVYEARSLGRYRLLRPIGRGGMGEVWVARHNALRRDVAVKILRPDKLDPITRERFEREVRATTELSHPNTVRIFDFGVTDDGLCYYAMELLDGEDLENILRREGPLDPMRAARLVLQACKALAEAHERNIIHRDIKPQNLFVTHAGPERDLVKLLDFGLALVKTPDEESALTQTGWVVGTPAYVAPELVTGQTADARSDVYALGAVLYRLLCGVAPLEDSNAQAMLAARMNEDPPQPSAILGTPLPPSLEEIVMRCLRRHPQERYPSAASLANALALFATGLGGARSENRMARF
jgi:tRNA A-37 threonylcarbamoyl transferase component Bud32